MNIYPYSALSTPRYALTKGLGAWELTFEGRRAFLKHEQGIYYVAYLLTHPQEEPLHGLALALKTARIYGTTRRAASLPDPRTGRLVPVGFDSEFLERSLGLDDAEAAGALRRKQRALEAILDDDSESEPVKTEALRELQAIYDFHKKHPWRTRATAQKTADTVAKAIKRFHGHLDKALDAEGRPHHLLCSFARHLRDYLLRPSGRGNGPGGPRLGLIAGGSFTYQPPPGVRWVADTE